jgi:oligoribonuclease
VSQPQALLDGMDEWNKRTHGGSGLIERVKASTVSETEAERAMLEFLGRHVPAKRSPMCGNSICQDRRFLARTMPALEAWFHYRNLDVSTLKELAVRWRPEMANAFTKKATHRALDDVRESIEELRYYRENFFRTS